MLPIATASSPSRSRSGSHISSSSNVPGRNGESEREPLLSPTLNRTRRPSLSRKRRLSHMRPTTESWLSRHWNALLGFALLVFMCLVVLLIVLREEIPRRRKKADDTPEFTTLPPPQPGLRNPSYLVNGWNGAVASEVDVCSEIGVDVLRENGTATDAAIATALCIGVTNMFSSGIGGGGFMVIRPPTNSTRVNCTSPIAIDFREVAPALAFQSMFAPVRKHEDFPEGFPRPTKEEEENWDGNRASKVGGLAAGVPGELRGLEAAYRACGGGVPWARLFEPSIRLANRSPIGKELGRRLNLRLGPAGIEMFGWMRNYKEWSDVFVKSDGGMKEVGDHIERPEYAETLKIISILGADAFYTGPLAESIVRAAQDRGGVLSLSDFAAYQAKITPAIEGTYLGRKYYTSQAPSGGPVLVSLLNTLENYPDWIRDGRTGLQTHRFVEALKFAFGARTTLGDPDFVDNTEKLARIMSKQWGKEVHANITDDRTHHLSYYNPVFDVLDDHGTTHMSTVDQWGSAVSLTSTVNLLFGSQVMDPVTGVILNDEMDDFATPGLPDAFGLRPSPFNYPQPGKRPMSSTAPMVMDDEEGEVFLAMGGSGGSRIFGAVAQVLLNLDWGYDLSNSIEQSRVHDQLLPQYVSIESGFREDLLQALKERGHNVTLFDVNMGIAEVQAVLRDTKGRFWGASDSRKNGVPAAY